MKTFSTMRYGEAPKFLWTKAGVCYRLVTAGNATDRARYGLDSTYPFYAKTYTYEDLLNEQGVLYDEKPTPPKYSVQFKEMKNPYHAANAIKKYLGDKGMLWFLDSAKQHGQIITSDGSVRVYLFLSNGTTFIDLNSSKLSWPLHYMIPGDPIAAE